MTGNLTGPPRIECGPGLTTVGRRSTALKACGKEAAAPAVSTTQPYQQQHKVRAMQL